MTAPDELIAEYTAAFRAANTLSEPPDITYASGWFTFKTPRMYSRKYRRHVVEQLRDVLRNRVTRQQP